MDPVLPFIVFGSIIIVGFMAEILFKKIKIPDIIILIIIGVILGQFYPIQQASFFGLIPLFTTFALLFILFEGALKLKMKQLFNQLPKSLVLTVVSFVLTVGIAYLLGIIMQLPPHVSLYLGFMLGGTSSAVVIPLVRFLRMSKDTGIILTLESAFSDVLAIIATVVLTEVIIASQVSAQSVLNTMLSTITIALFIGLITGFGWVTILKKWSTDNSYFLTIALLLIIYAFTEWVGANGAIACLVFGLVLGNARKVTEKLEHTNEGTDEIRISSKQVLTGSARNFYAEISFFVKTFFFVYLGMLIDFSSPIAFVYAFVLVIGFFAVRPLAAIISKSGNDLKERYMVNAMIPKGLAAAVLAAVPLQAGITGTEVIPNIVLAVILMSIVFASVMLFLIQQGKFRSIYSWIKIERK